MAQFGAGSALAAQCPVAPIPDGWRGWFPDSDGPIPDALLKRAQALAADASVPLGATESYPLPGVVTLIRVEPRVWGRDEKGLLVEGCWRSAGVFLPSGGASITPPSSPSSLSRTVGIVTVVSLVVGTLATLAAWSRA
jgi:hypothetical protein